MNNRKWLLLFSGLIGLSAVSACSSSSGGGGLFNRDKGDEAEDVAEEDDGRIPVLALQEQLSIDPRFIGVPVTLPPAFTNIQWSQPGGEADHVMHHLSGPEVFKRDWTASIGGDAKKAPLTAPPIVAEDKVFAVDPAARVVAFDVERGGKVWTSKLTPNVREEAKKFWQFGGRDAAEIGFGGGLAYDGGRVFHSSGFAKATALSALDGEVLWEVDLPAPVRNPPTATNGLVLMVTISNEIIALDQNSGETVWTHESFEEAARFLSSGSPAVDGDVVIAPFSSGEVVALDFESGRLLWSASVSRSSRLTALADLNDIAGSPAIDRGAVFAVSHSGQFSAIDGRTGRVAWEQSVASLNMPWIAADYVFLVSLDGQLLAFSRDDGAVVWKAELPAYENPKKKKKKITWSGPVLVGGNLVLVSTTGRMVQASPQNGEIVKEYKLGEGTSLPPVIADGTLYILNNKGRLEAWR